MGISVLRYVYTSLDDMHCHASVLTYIHVLLCRA